MASFTPENSGLPNAKVNALSLGFDGTLWIGTDGGLASLDNDGRWRTYNKLPLGGLPDDRVRAVASGTDGVVWVGTFNRGVARLDRDGSWRTYSEATHRAGMPNSPVKALVLGTDGALWVGSAGDGLARFGMDGHWQIYTKVTTHGGLPDDEVQALAIGVDGALWVGTHGGLARLGKDGGWQTFTKVITDSGMPLDAIQALTTAADGAVWVGTVGGDLVRLDNEGHWKTYGKADRVQVLAPAADGAVWVGTSRGELILLNKEGSRQTYINGTTLGSILDNSIQAVATGSSGVLWVGTSGHGMKRLEKDGRWQTFANASTHGGLPVESITALASGSDGELWVGTSGGGLARLGKDEHWQKFTKLTTNGGLPDNQVRALAFDRDRSLWIGTSSGLVRRDKNGGWQTYTKATTHDSLPNDTILALAVGPDGTLWVGTGGGVATRREDGNWQTYSTATSIGMGGSGLVMALAPGPDGVPWVGTGGGVARRRQDGRWQTYSNATTLGGLLNDVVLALALSAEGTLWVGTLGGDAMFSTLSGGLSRRDKDGSWQAYSRASTAGGLPNDSVRALALGVDDTLWVGTEGGLARLDKDGRWQTYTDATTNGGLPYNSISALIPNPDGSVWVGTLQGLAHFLPSLKPTHRIVEVIGNVGEVHEEEQTVSVTAFDANYRTEPWMFRYVWQITELHLLGNRLDAETRTRSPVYRARFNHDGDYDLRVYAIDINGVWSEPRDIKFKVTLPKSDPTRALVVQTVKWLATSGVLYFLLIFPLIRLYPRFSWARTAINSGVFTKFPFAHKAILNLRWSRRYLFRQLAAKASATRMPEPYISQSVFAAADKDPQLLSLNGSQASLGQLFATQRRVLLVARSGTGKSVFLRYLQREVAGGFERGECVPAPVLIDLRTHVLSGRKVQDLVRDALHGAGIELADGDLDFLIGKGGFLILVDSLNELPDPADARLFHTFFNQDAGNLVLVASQVDLIRRQDTPLFNLAEVTPEQAASFLAKAAGREIYSELPEEAQALARNPQDLALLAEVAKALGTAHVPTHRAELYREILNQDGALRPWVESGDPLLAIIYGLAFRMVAERRVLQDGQLREWIAADPAVSGDAVAKVMQAMQASRLFRREVERDVLGKEQPVTGFRHELIGKFLAARHARLIIRQNAGSATVDYISLSGDELWLDMFYFVIDEINSSPVLNRFLQEILAAGGPSRMRITAYAIGTRRAELGSEVLASYEKAKLDEDLALTPAG